MSAPAVIDIIYISDDECDTPSPKTPKVPKLSSSFSGSVLFKAPRSEYGNKSISFRKTLFEFFAYIKRSEPEIGAVLKTNYYITRKVSDCICDICRNDDTEEDYYFMYPAHKRMETGSFSLYNDKLQNFIEVCSMCYNQWLYQVIESDCELHSHNNDNTYRLVKVDSDAAKYSYISVQHTNLYIAMQEQ